MSKSTLFTIIILSICAFLLGYNYFFQPFADTTANTNTVQPSASPQISGVAAQLQSLSLDQKLALLLAVPIDISKLNVGGEAIPIVQVFATDSGTLTANMATDSASTQDWIKQHQPGAVTIFGDDIGQSQVRQLRQSLEQLSIRPWLAVDHEGGSVQRLKGNGFSTLPSWRELCSLDETTFETTMASSSAELASAGIDMVLGPVVDVASQSGVLRSRICSNSYETVTARTLQVMKIFEKDKIIPVIKHFPGIGQAKKDLHFSFDRVTVSSADAVQYRLLLEQFPQAGVMITHIGVLNQFPDLPCSLSQSCVQQLAQLFPESLIVSDALDMKSAGYQKGTVELLQLPERAVAAVRAGNQLLLFSAAVSTEQLDEVLAALHQQYLSDTTFATVVDRAVKQILERKMK